jgi:LacI family transcriptional regulator
MITIKDIAERAGVSYATVSRALNNRSDVSSTTRKLICELAAEMGYQPNAIARSLVKRKSMNIALIVPDVSNPFFADITMAVNSAAENAGYTTMVCNTAGTSRRNRKSCALWLSSASMGHSQAGRVFQAGDSRSI